MNTTRPCGCKGCRTCLICENDFKIAEKTFMDEISGKKSYTYCPWCDKAWENWQCDASAGHTEHSGKSIYFPGVFIKLDFISEEEEINLMKGIDEMPWEQSQSGRRKQNFGPKTNFKKRKMKMGDFKGFPEFSRFVQEKFQQIPLLSNYRTIEQCSLEYDPTRGASIDPHIDDCWVWGERVVTVNCLTDAVLTMTPYKGDKNKYNLSDCYTYHRVLNDNGQLIDDVRMSGPPCIEKDMKLGDIIVRIPMPRRSLIVLYGEARYNWEHCVLREDVKERRVCIAYREFTPPFLPGGLWENEGSEILDAANSFWNHRYVNVC